MKVTATSELIRTINRSTILDLIREKGPISRAELSRKVGVSQSTVMRVVDELTDEELVLPAGSGKSTGGRPGSLVEFNETGFAVVAVDLGGTKIYGSLTDLGGTIQHEISVPSVQESLSELIRLIDSLLKTPRPSGQKVMGIGIGAPGVTLPNGVVTLAPGLGWKSMSLKSILAERFDYPVYVENDVNLAALGEYGFGAGRGVQNLVSIFVGTGIGAGIIIGGALYRGHNCSAGEIGYMVPSTEFLGKEYAGFGALEDVASGTGIADKARGVLMEVDGSIPTDDLTAKDVFEAARSGEDWAVRIVDETVDYLTIAVANVSAFLDPEMIVLSGGVMESADLIFEPVQARLEGLMPKLPELVLSSLGPKATVLGATMLVMTAVTGSTAVKQLP
jgi:glucokinase-like ROK family protein